ncbi:hypothetical protein GCM10017556_03530 [Micromonospora sagamiensis]|nr:hypothetical protein GCM10017556_03530 [Micromonospora sagamiensis]
MAASSAATVPTVTRPPRIRERRLVVSDPVLASSSVVATAGCLPQVIGLARASGQVARRSPAARP